MCFLFIRFLKAIVERLKAGCREAAQKTTFQQRAARLDPTRVFNRVKSSFLSTKGVVLLWETKSADTNPLLTSVLGWSILFIGCLLYGISERQQYNYA